MISKLNLKYIHNNILNTKITNTNIILHIIIIKMTDTPLSKLITNHNNNKLKISIISKYHNNNIDELNNILDNNNSKYYMIMYDNYQLEINFCLKILNYLNDKSNIDMLILYQDNQYNNNYFNITPDFFKKNYNNNICIINNNIKKHYSYSFSVVGLFLYNYSIICDNNNNNILGTTYYKFDIINNNTEYIKDIIILFDIYFSNIESNIIKNYKLNNLDQKINLPLIDLES